VNLNREGYARLLDEFGLWSFPRRVGNPFSVTVGNPSGFYRWWDSNVNLPVPMFIAHNAFAEPPAGQRLDVNAYRFRAGFADLDTGDNNGCTPEQVWDEVCRIEDWARKVNVPHVWKYSGSDSGWHCHLLFDEQIASRSYLDKWENALWRGLTVHLRLRSINIRCADPARMERLPFSKYVHKKDKDTVGYKVEPNWCVPVPWKLMVDQNLPVIRELSRNPKCEDGAHRYVAPSTRLEAFVRLQHWETFGPEKAALHPSLGFEPKGSMADLTKVLIPFKKCLQTLPFGTNPRHAVRLAYAVELASTGMSLDELTTFIDKVSEEAGWIDRQNEQARHGQVQQLHRRGYTAFGCHKLRESGCCVGQSCSLFARSFPNEVKP
jgi:hypothetical protein